MKCALLENHARVEWEFAEENVRAVQELPDYMSLPGKVADTALLLRSSRA